MSITISHLTIPAPPPPDDWSALPPYITEMAEGPDGNIWFAGQAPSDIGYITPSTGAVTQFDVDRIFYAIYGSAASQIDPWAICAGPDGNMWWTDLNQGSLGNGIYKCTLAGDMTRYDIPGANDYPYNICAGPDGNLWFCALFGAPNGYIGVMNTSGAMVATYPRVGSAPEDICVGPDGNLWVVDGNFGDVTKMTPAGVSTIYGGLSAKNCFPVAICAGPDGNLWFVENNSGKIGKMSTDGVLLGEFFVPIPAGDTYTSLQDIAAGGDGNLWVTNDTASDKLFQITPSGIITTFPNGDTPAMYGTWRITPTASGNLWFGEAILNEVGIIHVPFPKLCTPPPSFGKLQLINDGYKAFADNLYK